MILLLAPLFELKPVYLAAFLIICMVPVVLFRRPALLVAAIMFSRAILDTTLANTRLSIGGFHTGIGGLINFVVILLGVLFASKNVESFRRFPFLKPWTVRTLPSSQAEVN
ncbi:MAG: hypothetical protein WCG06_06840, partial [Candidatus Omnitrophota bacterium]